ncbi:DNA repair protein RecO, partial [termite gut metagenome]
MLHKTTGIVLHTLKYNDTSTIVEIFTELCGRASFVVSISRSKKMEIRLGLFQPLALIEFEADFRPTTTSLYRIKEAKSLIPFTTIPYNPFKSAISLFLAEFLYRALREEGENRSLFAFLKYSIVWLDEVREGYANFHLVFLMHLSRFLGLYPNLENYRKGDYFDLLNADFTSTRPLQHSFFI